MLEDNPILKQRLLALGAFSGIAVFAVAALDVMVTGGFDFGPGRTPYDRTPPSAYVQVVDAARYVGDRFRQISWNEPIFIETSDAATAEHLAGDNDGSPPPTTFGTAEELYQDIAALYEDARYGYREAPQYEDAPAANANGAYEHDVYGEAASALSEAEADKIASAYGNESPW
jgi:hypothetical protein